MVTRSQTEPRRMRARREQVLDVLARPSWTGLGVAAAMLALTDLGAQRSSASFWPGGPLDLTAHFLTALIALWALDRRLPDAFLGGALVASVLIDLDHVPGHLGVHLLTAGTPRPYTHSLLTIAVVLAFAAVLSGRRMLLFGVAAGLALHFWRDVGDPGSGVALLWPFSDYADNVPRVVYVASMVVLVLVVAVQLRAADRRRGVARR
jgi:inner membrane protein